MSKPKGSTYFMLVKSSSFSVNQSGIVSDNAYIILQIVYKMFDIKDIFKFPVEKANVPNNVGNMSENKTQHM